MQKLTACRRFTRYEMYHESCVEPASLLKNTAIFNPNLFMLIASRTCMQSLPPPDWCFMVMESVVAKSMLRQVPVLRQSEVSALPKAATTVVPFRIVTSLELPEFWKRKNPQTRYLVYNELKQYKTSMLTAPTIH